PTRSAFPRARTPGRGSPRPSSPSFPHSCRASSSAPRLSSDARPRGTSMRGRHQLLPEMTVARLSVLLGLLMAAMIVGPASRALSGSPAQTVSDLNAAAARLYEAGRYRDAEMAAHQALERAEREL